MLLLKSYTKCSLYSYNIDFFTKILFISDLLLEHVSDVFYTSHFDFTTGKGLLVGCGSGIQTWLSQHLYSVSSGSFSGWNIMDDVTSKSHIPCSKGGDLWEEKAACVASLPGPYFHFSCWLVDNLYLFLFFSLPEKYE